MSQTFCIPPGNCLTRVEFDWAALLGEPHGHKAPYFKFEVTRGNETLADFNISGDDAGQAAGWTVAGSSGSGDTIWFGEGRESLCVDTSVSGALKVTVEVGDCVLGAHGAAAFFDNLTVTPLPGKFGPIPAPFIANYLSPNGDGITDTWQISNVHNAHSLHVEIRDRWGVKVHEKSITKQIITSAPISLWNGEIDGSTANPDTYFYTLSLENCDKELEIGSFITLLP